MSIRRIRTTSSIWLINTDTRKCSRLPLGDENIDPLMLEWEPYESLEEGKFGIMRIKVGSTWFVAELDGKVDGS